MRATGLKAKDGKINDKDDQADFDESEYGGEDEPDFRTRHDATRVVPMAEDKEQRPGRANNRGPEEQQGHRESIRAMLSYMVRRWSTVSIL